MPGMSSSNLRQRAELCLRMLVAGVDFRAVGSMRWHVEVLAFIEHELLDETRV